MKRMFKENRLYIMKNKLICNLRLFNVNQNRNEWSAHKSASMMLVVHHVASSNPNSQSYELWEPPYRWITTFANPNISHLLEAYSLWKTFLDLESIAYFDKQYKKFFSHILPYSSSPTLADGCIVDTNYL